MRTIMDFDLLKKESSEIIQIFVHYKHKNIQENINIFGNN